MIENGEGLFLWQVGNKVRKERLKRKWTIDVLAKKSGYSKSMLSQVENGLNSLSLQGFFSLCKILNIDLAELIKAKPTIECPRCQGSGAICN